MSCHVSVLSSGQSPHPPHAHLEEEILVVLDGCAEIVIADAPDKPTKRTRLTPGSFVYYPALQHHTIHNPSPTPITYLMLKWRGPPAETTAPLATEIVNYSNLPPKPIRQARDTWLLFEGPTAYLGRVHAHFTELRPGAGYTPHADTYDVAIILLAGTVETVGQILPAHAVMYFAAGEPHGMHNPGTSVARYLVFEFESAGSGGSNRGCGGTPGIDPALAQ